MKYVVTIATLAFATTCFAQVPDYVPADGLVAWYNLDGNGEDAWGENSADYYQAVVAANRFGEAGMASSFVAESDDFIRGSADGMPVGDRTVSMWVKSEYSYDDTWVFGYGQHLCGESASGGSSVLYFNSPDCSMAGAMAHTAHCCYAFKKLQEFESDWTHWVYANDSQGLRFYRNGVQIAVGPQAIDVNVAGSNFYLGSAVSFDGVGRWNDFDGVLDECGIWNRALSSEEISGLYVPFIPSLGCTNEESCNFDPEANAEDGSCMELDACGECGGEGVAGCNDASACNFDPAATCDDGSCDYCSCVGDVVFGANFDDVLIQYGANELFTTDEDLDLSSIENQRILDVEGGEGYFIVMNEDSTLTTLCEGCLYGNPPPSTWKVLDVEVGRHEGCLVRVDGSLHSFGANYLGLQNEPTVDNAIQCAASWNFHMALLDDGEVVGWGNGWEPCPLPLSGVVEIDAGGGHAVALMENGTLVEWGRLDDGSVAHSQEWILDLEQVVHVVAGQNSTWMFFADGSAKLVEFPSGDVWLELPTESGVVDGDRNWAVTSYLKNDGGVYIQQNSGTSEVELDLSAHENCGTCVLDSDEDGTCNLDEVFGCADEAGCNYAGEATQNAGCVYPILPEADCSAGSVMCGEGTVWDTATQTCLSAPSEQGPCLDGTVWDEDLQGCIVANPSDTDFDGCVSMTDLLDLLSVFGTCTEEESEEDPEVAEWSCGDPLEYQGYDYETVQIGEQCWFAENLRAEDYRNGDVIPTGLSDVDWQATEAGAVAIYQNDESYLPTYGRLYNWYTTTDGRGLCPNGWQVPSDEDWIEFEMGLGMSEADAFGMGFRGTDEGVKMKAAVGWLSGGNGTNESGFSGLPGGERNINGSYLVAGIHGYWWSSSPLASNALMRYLHEANDGIDRSMVPKQYGYAVRCIQNAE